MNVIQLFHTIKQTISCSYFEPKTTTAGRSDTTRCPVLNRSSDVDGYWTRNDHFLPNPTQKTHLWGWTA